MNTYINSIYMGTLIFLTGSTIRERDGGKICISQMITLQFLH